MKSTPVLANHRRASLAIVAVILGVLGWTSNSLWRRHSGDETSTPGRSRAATDSRTSIGGPQNASIVDGVGSVGGERTAPSSATEPFSRSGNASDVEPESAPIDDESESSRPIDGNCLNGSELTPDCPDTLARALSEGAESERLAALNMALENGIELPAEILRWVYESDPSDRVRLLAFTTFVDSISDDATRVRDALQSATFNDRSPVRAEAQRRLQELDQFELAVAQTPPQGMP